METMYCSPSLNEFTADQSMLTGLLSHLMQKRQNLVDEMSSIDSKIKNTHVGVGWISVGKAFKLKLGSIYMIRRVRHGKYAEPGLHEWTNSGWKYVCGNPIDNGSPIVDDLQVWA